MLTSRRRKPFQQTHKWCVSVGRSPRPHTAHTISQVGDCASLPGGGRRANRTTLRRPKTRLPLRHQTMPGQNSTKANLLQGNASQYAQSAIRISCLVPQHHSSPPICYPKAVNYCNVIIVNGYRADCHLLVKFQMTYVQGKRSCHSHTCIL